MALAEQPHGSRGRPRRREDLRPLGGDPAAGSRTRDSRGGLFEDNLALDRPGGEKLQGLAGLEE